MINILELRGAINILERACQYVEFKSGVGCYKDEEDAWHILRGLHKDLINDAAKHFASSYDADIV